MAANIKRGLAAFAAGILCLFVLFELGARLTGYAVRAFGSSSGGSGRTVLCAGDSFVYGIGGVSFPAQLQRILDSSGRQYRVINAGIPGANTARTLSALEGQLAKYHPDTVILLTGFNNSWNTLQSPLPARDSLLMHSAFYRFIKHLASSRRTRSAPYAGMSGPHPGLLVPSSSGIPAQDILPDLQKVRAAGQIVARAKENMSKGRRAEAARQMLEAAKINPACDDCYRVAADYYLASGNTHEAKQYFYQAVRVKGNNLPPEYLAKNYELFGSSVNAIYYYSLALESGHGADVCQPLVSLQSSGGDFRSAEKTLSNCVKNGVPADPLYLSLFNAAFTYNALDEYLAFARHSLETNPLSPVLNEKILFIMNSRGEEFRATYETRDEAAVFASGAAAKFPDSFEISLQAARAYQGIRDFRTAGVYAARARALAGTNLAKKTAAALSEFFIALNGGTPESALSAARSYAGLSSDRFQSSYIMGFALLNAGEYREARRKLEAAVSFAVNDESRRIAYWKLLETYRLSGENQAILKICASLLRISPSDPDIYAYLFAAAAEMQKEDSVGDIMAAAYVRSPSLSGVPGFLQKAVNRMTTCQRRELARRFPQLVSDPLFSEWLFAIPPSTAEDCRREEIRKREVFSDPKKLSVSRQDKNTIAYRELSVSNPADNKFLKDDMERIYGLCRRYGARLILSSYPEKSFLMVREVAERHGLSYADMGKIFAGRFKTRSEWVSYDNVHCNSAGYRVMAETYADMIGGGK